LVSLHHPLYKHLNLHCSSLGHPGPFLHSRPELLLFTYENGTKLLRKLNVPTGQDACWTTSSDEWCERQCDGMSGSMTTSRSFIFHCPQAELSTRRRWDSVRILSNILHPCLIPVLPTWLAKEGLHSNPIYPSHQQVHSSTTTLSPKIPTLARDGSKCPAQVSRAIFRQYARATPGT
jgi:hypothetical protein